MTQLKTDRPPKIDGYDLDTADGCRQAYRALRFYAVRMSYSSPYGDNAAFDAAASALAGAEPTPQAWVAAARRVAWPCKRCGTTGRFITMVENGQPKGPGGACFRCNGKGAQTPEDAHRNHWHDNFHLARALA